jgi:hypothetical protein
VSQAFTDAWGCGYHENEICETLSDIALGLDALVCNEAVSEGTNSPMK